MCVTPDLRGVGLRRRDVIASGAVITIAALSFSRAHAAPSAADRAFLDEAFKLREQAVAAGDQPYGAVLVLDGKIVGRGASRVVSDRNPDAHAERVALWAAQAALGRILLDDAVIYSSSVPCGACQGALAAAHVGQMIHGRDGIDAGRPRGS